MLKRMKRTVAVLAAVCMLLACAAGLAQTMHREIRNDGFDMEVQVGYNGMMTYGKVMPVRVRIRNFGADFEGVLGMNAYVSSTEYDRYEKEIFVPAGAEREFELDLTVYARQDTFTAEITQDGTVVCAANAKPDKIVNPSSMLIGVLSSRPRNLNNLNIDRDNDTLARYELWQAVALTPDNFPENAAALRSFGMLVIDDIDPAELSEKQQNLLAGWLDSGRVLVCGGGQYAGRNIAYFSNYTGLKLDGVSTSDSVAAGLAKLINRTVNGDGVSVTVAELSGTEAIAADAEGRGLVWRTEVGGGRIYTTAFESGDPRLNSENLMHFFWQQLLADLDQDVYSNMTYAETEGFSSSAVNAGYATPVTARSNLVPGIMIVAGALVLCCLAWWILKKKDRRQWMWAVLPAVAVLTVASVILLSTGAQTNQPMAVVTENIVQNASGAVRNYSGIAVASPAFGRHSYSTSGDNLRVAVYDYVDFDEENDDKTKEPDKMRTCYTAGGENTVTLESTTPWEQFNLTTDSEAKMQGKIDGEVWMEEDGIHGEVMNGTDLKLSAGYVITTYGYVSVPALAPGEKAEFVLERKKLASIDNPKYEDGGLYLETPNQYQVISQAVGYTDEERLKNTARERQERELVYSMVSGAVETMRRAQDNWNYGSSEGSVFEYSAKAENAEEATLKVDGRPVVQKASLVMIHAELPFAVVGRTGVVFRSGGMDMPVRVDTDENLLPKETVMQSGKQIFYHSLTEVPTFLFELDGMAGVKVTKLQVLMDYYYQNQARVYALNAEKREWEEIHMNEDIPNPERYLDSKGRLYLQFRSDSADMYADISTPVINLEGRVENAAD